MAKGKNGVLIYKDWIKTVEKLKDNQAGQLFKHLLRYVNERIENKFARFKIITLLCIAHS